MGWRETLRDVFGIPSRVDMVPRAELDTALLEIDRLTRQLAEKAKAHERSEAFSRKQRDMLDAIAEVLER